MPTFGDPRSRARFRTAAERSAILPLSKADLVSFVGRMRPLSISKHLEDFRADTRLNQKLIQTGAHSHAWTPKSPPSQKSFADSLGTQKIGRALEDAPGQLTVFQF